MKAVIFGINSQDGIYLRNILDERGIEVIGVSRSEGNWTRGSVSDYPFVNGLIKDSKPDYVFHLAANSTTRHDALFENHETISTGTLNVLESVKNHNPSSKVFITGSGIQFKNSGKPISEKDEFEATCAYSVSRIQSVYAARYFRDLGIRTYVGYLFHHESPYRKDSHISKLTTNFIKGLNPASTDKLTLGDISVKKEWAFAQDIAEGIFALVNQEELHEACIGTGVAYSIEDWLKECFAIKGLNYQDHIQLADKSFRAEYKLLVSDPSSMNRIGWKAKTSFSDLARIMCTS
jgi:GDPmannose 4,6-dehydratase